MTGCRTRASCSRRAMARQLHRTKWALCWFLSLTCQRACLPEASPGGFVSSEPGMCRWLRMWSGWSGWSGWPPWLDGGRRSSQRSGVCGFCTIQLNLHAYLRYRVCGCRLIKLLFMHVVVLADIEARRGLLSSSSSSSSSSQRTLRRSFHLFVFYTR